MARTYTENNILHLSEMLEQWATSFNPEAYTVQISTSFAAPNGKVAEDEVSFPSVEDFLERAPRHPGNLK